MVALTLRTSTALVLALAVFGCADTSEDTPATETNDAVQALEAIQQEITAEQRGIDAWLVGWSKKQSASIREQCSSGALACDPASYLPEARPETTFGWDGASEVTRTTDWARGRRYWVEAGGRRVLLYLEGGQVASAYMDPPGQPRRNLCCGIEECN